MQVIVGLLLDDGGRQLARALVGLAVAPVLALVLAVSIPVMFLADLATAAVPGVTRTAPQQTPIALPPTSSGGTTVEVARRYLGVPYVFGGSNPATGLDCSGLVQLVFGQVG